MVTVNDGNERSELVGKQINSNCKQTRLRMQTAMMSI